MSASTKGIYVLLIQLDVASCIQAGKRRFHLDSGFYGYVGSALSGLERRLTRHLRTDKRFHWHIDYLLNVARINKVICGETGKSKECALARIFSQKLTPINGFGCSDCRCTSHLFFCEDQHFLENLALDSLKSLDLHPFRYPK